MPESNFKLPAKQKKENRTGAYAPDDDQQTEILTFEDNRLLPQLFGLHHMHLSILEDRLGIHIVAHGNMVTLTGAEEDVFRCAAILNNLYERLQKGEDIGQGEIDGAIRHAAPRDDEARPENHPSPDKTKQETDASGNDKKPALSRAEVIETRKKKITSRSPRQSRLIKLMRSEQLIIALGAAGTGKTYLAVAHAASQLEKGHVERIILSRPAVEAGERLGFLPGDMKEKVDPYLRPLYDALYDVLAARDVEKYIEQGIIEIAPLAFMRGRTLTRAAVILDEAQNTTSMQMKMFLTRLGEDSQMIITGDPSQIDLPRGEISGLMQAAHLLENIEGVGKVAFRSDDVVRHPLVARIVAAYDRLAGKE